MKNWQKNRNYKRVKDKDGNVVANIITVFGQDVEVSDEIFATYAQVDRRARYVGEDIPAQHELSLEQFEEEGVSLEKLIRETAPSAEEWFMEQEESNAFERELLKVPAVLDMLEDSDRQLINALFYKGICNGVQREHNKKLNNGLPILHKVPPKRDYGRYFCIMAEKGGTSHGGLTEKLSPFFHAKKQEVNAYGR